MNSCPICLSSLEIRELQCPSCKVSFTGNFTQSRLARLSFESVELAEQFILSGGNLKDLATQMGITYPTMRKKIDSLIDELVKLRNEDDRIIDELLKQVEKGEIQAEEAARRIKGLHGGS